ncbi:SH3 domain-containing protein [Alteromonas lipolytica]|uniref:SH3b domain-containing protein n=1 Tax=Alteromonas lipolytica TaxID=1856405 RepID=A0A1E8FE20_9ALTE|nr:SH3 domain-containing protein [Alteromonas lipolytica]OFI34197.1 hypothetical protein BFC17_21915 [Alteromonas lipolytica]GGF84222.1 hypothetical protein GCM10011338_40650 [Alteromonas lipolytica]
MKFGKIFISLLFVFLISACVSTREEFVKSNNDENVTKATEYVDVRDEPLLVYTSHSRDSELVSSLYKGEKFKLTGSKAGKYYEVLFYDDGIQKSGWVADFAVVRELINSQRLELLPESTK